MAIGQRTLGVWVTCTPNASEASVKLTAALVSVARSWSSVEVTRIVATTTIEPPGGVGRDERGGGSRKSGLRCWWLWYLGEESCDVCAPVKAILYSPTSTSKL